MGVSTGGIILNIIALILIIVAVIATIFQYEALRTCNNNQSDFCYTIVCPNAAKDEKPCGMYPKRPGPRPDTWYCNNAPLTLVDNNGSILTG